MLNSFFPGNLEGVFVVVGKKLMEKAKIIAVEDGIMMDSLVGIVVAAALVGDGSSKHIINWMLDKFSSENNVIFKLLHVRPQIKLVPTPMGNYIPISQVREDVAAAYRKEMEWRAADKISPYKKMFLHRKVPVNVVMIESDDAPNAIAAEVKTSSITKLVIEISSNSLFSRKPKGSNLLLQISECIPSTCTVYAISKGKLKSVQPSAFDRNESSIDDSSDKSLSHTDSSSMNSIRTDAGSSLTSFDLRSLSIPSRTFQALAMDRKSFFNQGINSYVSYHTRDQSLNTMEIDYIGVSCPADSEIGLSTYKYFTCSSLDNAASDQHGASSSKCEEFFDLELEKLKIELRHVRTMSTIAQTETLDASKKIDELNILRLEENTKLKELKEREEKALKFACEEKERSEAASREAEAATALAEREAVVRKFIEKRAMADAEEKEKLENAVTGQVQNYQTFTWEEIIGATSSFSKELEIGSGANGTVYKCTLRHTTAAAKVLHSLDARRINQFSNELEILSRIHHPHLLMLLGACPEHGCLVYEYMKNGNLEDKLHCTGGKLPLPWVDRFRIAWEVASALVFLHCTKPKSIIHCDLKPVNILLDDSHVSKIGDFGLSTILNPDPYLPVEDEDAGLVGTLCYMDPEYQRSGIVNPMLDVYAFGMVILQLLTGRRAMALAHIVETAVMGDTLSEVLDSRAGSWPVEETKELALLGLSCLEIRRKDRPDLKHEVLPKLEKLKEAAAAEAKKCTHTLLEKPPAHFICPILKEVMEEPHVAADGYTYDLKAIKKIFEKTDQSPITGLPLPHKHLVPNYSLLSAILRWQSLRY